MNVTLVRRAGLACAALAVLCWLLVVKKGSERSEPLLQVSFCEISNFEDLKSQTPMSTVSFSWRSSPDDRILALCFGAVEG